jgi:hypothetical protein
VQRMTLVFLFSLTASETRLTDPDYAQGYKVMFSDAFPILIASQVVVFRVQTFFCVSVWRGSVQNFSAVSRQMLKC